MNADMTKLVETTERLARVNNDQWVAITVMSLTLIVIIIAFFLLLVKVLKSGDRRDADLQAYEEATDQEDKSVRTRLALIESKCQEIHANSVVIRESLKIHTQQNERIKGDLLRISNCMNEVLKEIIRWSEKLKGVSQGDGKPATE